MSLARRRHALAAAVATLAIAGCTAGPRPIDYGHEECAFCRMTVSDPRFGAELVTTTGVVRTFDSIECLVSYYAQVRDSGRVRSLWVSDFQHPGTLLPAERAQYVRGATVIGTPMGRGLAAFAPDADIAAAARTLGGQPARWADVVALVQGALRAPGEESPAGAGAAEASHAAR